MRRRSLLAGIAFQYHRSLLYYVRIDLHHVTRGDEANANAERKQSTAGVVWMATRRRGLRGSFRRRRVVRRAQAQRLARGPEQRSEAKGAALRRRDGFLLGRRDGRLLRRPRSGAAIVRIASRGGTQGTKFLGLGAQHGVSRVAKIKTVHQVFVVRTFLRPPLQTRDDLDQLGIGGLLEHVGRTGRAAAESAPTSRGHRPRRVVKKTAGKVDAAVQLVVRILESIRLGIVCPDWHRQELERPRRDDAL
mmetsp:Transcript_34808/g.106926  ORF Transcript_34808/g.106926 Transcript_34808/m.106926 type:complete len:248 (+) Transcript_34808:338-1081(+)